MNRSVPLYTAYGIGFHRYQDLAMGIERFPLGSGGESESSGRGSKAHRLITVCPKQLIPRGKQTRLEVRRLQ